MQRTCKYVGRFLQMPFKAKATMTKRRTKIKRFGTVVYGLLQKFKRLAFPQGKQPKLRPNRVLQGSGATLLSPRGPAKPCEVNQW